jgi:hypothetical protein
LDEYAEHYEALVNAAGSLPVARFGRRIAAYDITTLYPLALFISTASIPDAQKIEMFDDLVSYVVRRAVCNLTSKNYNNVFLSALRYVARESLSPTVLRAALSSSESAVARWPSDAEFKNACLNGKLYTGHLDAAKMRSFLTELEGSLRSGVRSEEPELPNLSALDIDHVMPRSWHTHWELRDGSFATSGEVINVELMVRNGAELTSRQKEIKAREDAIQTLGNLTLLNLSVNREAKHYAFDSKRNLLIQNTALRLNVPVLTKQTWTVEDIVTRGETMSAEALKIWPGPQ